MNGGKDKLMHVCGCSLPFARDCFVGTALGLDLVFVFAFLCQMTPLGSCNIKIVIDLELTILHTGH